MNCYETIDLMGEELEGRLEPRFRADFDEHLAICGNCSTYLDQLRVTLKALENLPRESVDRRIRLELIEAFRRQRDQDS